MTPVFAAKRRAEEFNSLVEGNSTSNLQDARNADFLQLVASMREQPRIEASAEFVAELRVRLMAIADRALSAAPARTINDRLTVAHRRTARERRIAVAVGGFAIIGATTSMAMAAQSALPGDTLYPLKRAIENADAGFSVDNSQKGSTLLANATGRLDEVDEMSRAGDFGDDDVTAIAQTLNVFTEQASQASDLLMSDYESTGHEASIAELRDFTSESMAALSDLQSVVPDEARAALINAAQILTQIDILAQEACPTCGGAGIPVVPPFAVNTVVDDLLASLASSVAPAAERGDKAPGRGKGHAGPGKTGGAHPPTSALGAPESNLPDQSGDQPDNNSVGTIEDELAGGDPQPASGPIVPPDLGEVLGGVQDSVEDADVPLLP